MELTPQQEKFKSEVVQLTKDSWDAGWKACCEEFVKIAEEKGAIVAIQLMSTYTNG